VPVEIIRFDHDTATAVDQFDSRAASVNHVARIVEGRVVAVHLGPNGVLGRHAAVAEQMFVVVQGDGTVSGADGTAHTIRAGDAAIWRSGEFHESRTEHGMIAVVLEGDIFVA
jgi:quercetin dioxygenase-like cupin family protein